MLPAASRVVVKIFKAVQQRAVASCTLFAFLESRFSSLMVLSGYGRHLYVLALASSQQTSTGQIATFDHVRQCQFISLGPTLTGSAYSNGILFNQCVLFG